MQLGGEAAGLCSICQCQMSSEEQRTFCPTCTTPYHADCWRDNGGCGIYGCTSVPATEHRESLEISPSYWGQENKKCPACHQVILAAAMRCRNCGTVFSSARPESAGEFRQRSGRQQRAPALRRQIIALFVFSAIPCVSPLAAAFGFLWYSANREELKSLPGIYQGLCKIALGLGVTQFVFIVIIGLVYTAFQQAR